MARTTIKDLETRMNAMENKLDRLIASLEKQTAEAPKTKSSKSTKKSAPKTKSSETGDPWKKYEPVKDSDGNWNWRSYKNRRNKWLEDNGFGYAENGWMSREDFAKAVKPFTDHFGEYVKKADR